MSVGPAALSGLKVLDLGSGMATALVARMLADAGAEVLYAGGERESLFEQVYPALPIWRRGLECLKTSDLQSAYGLLPSVDVLIIGGESHPQIAETYDAAELARLHPKLVVLHIEGAPAFKVDHVGQARDILAQAEAGLVWEQYSERPNFISFSPGLYGAILQGLIGLLAALYEREASGLGQLVMTSLFEGAMGWAASFRLHAEEPTPASSLCVPKDSEPLIFRCADGRYIHIVLGSTGSKAALYSVLGIEMTPGDTDTTGLPSVAAGARNFFGEVDRIRGPVELRESGELLEALWATNVVADLCLAPGECWDDPQIEANGFILKAEDGQRFAGPPFSFKSSPAAWQGGPTEPSDRPLDGVKVVDFGAFVAGPLSSTVLADLGADVIKIEPLTGDPNRSVFRTFSSANRGKRSLTLDLKKPDELHKAREICKAADIVTSNFRPGVATRLGIGAEMLHGLKPDLVVLEASGFGMTGPSVSRPAFDMILQSSVGHEVHGGGGGGRPLWSRLAMVDYGCGLLGAVAALIGLLHRRRTGNGAALEVSLLQTALFLFSEIVRRPDGSFAGLNTLDAEQTGTGAACSLYACKDGWLAMLVPSNEAAISLSEVLERPALSSPPQEWGASQHNLLKEAVAAWHLRDLLAALEGTDVWTARTDRDISDKLLVDPALIKSGIIHRYAHPEYGLVSQTGPLYRFSRSSRGASAGPPQLGEHSSELLVEYGLAFDESEGSSGQTVLC
jgi:crotonobetainyl-CoA:carnitine CoA-transferase CaiB-like acyl-CoA transferase